jgi:hypothetical protein
MTKHATGVQTGGRDTPIMAGRLRAPVVIVILAVLAALAVFLKQYR